MHESLSGFLTQCPVVTLFRPGVGTRAGYGFQMIALRVHHWPSSAIYTDIVPAASLVTWK